MHEFLDDGLNNVFLANGFTVRETRHGQGVGISYVAQLTNEICVALAFRFGRLRGTEFRYIRRAMELTQADVARLFGRTEQTIANWEKRNLVPLEASHLLKELALKKFGYEQFVPVVLNQLGYDEHGDARIVMRFDQASEYWRSNFHPQKSIAESPSRVITFDKGAIDTLHESVRPEFISSLSAIVHFGRRVTPIKWDAICQAESKVLDFDRLLTDKPPSHRSSQCLSQKKHRLFNRAGT